MPIKSIAARTNNAEPNQCANPECTCTHEWIKSRYWQQYCCANCRKAYWKQLYTESRQAILKQRGIKQNG